MGLVVQPYQCDYVDALGVECPNTFIVENGDGYSYTNSCPQPAPNIAGFSCPNGQHRYCTANHAMLGSQSCLLAHIIPHRNALVTQYNTDHGTNII